MNTGQQGNAMSHPEAPANATPTAAGIHGPPITNPETPTATEHAPAKSSA